MTVKRVKKAASKVELRGGHVQGLRRGTYAKALYQISGEKARGTGYGK